MVALDVNAPPVREVVGSISRKLDNHHSSGITSYPIR